MNSAAGNFERTGEEPSDMICGTLQMAIAERALLPGTKLMEEVIARHFGVSRTVVRGAIAILERAHLVELRRNHGAFVASPDRAEARQLLEARRVLEMTTVAKAPQLAKVDGLDRLEDLTRDEEAVHGGSDAAAKQRLSGNFHVELARVAGNAVLAEVLQNVLARLSLVAAIYERAVVTRCAAGEHRAILDAIRAGDRPAAEAAMAHHLDDLEAMLDLDAPLDNPNSLSTVLEKFSPPAPRARTRRRG